MSTIISVNTTFQYCTLKYRHSIFLNENVNVGLLFFFKEEKKLEFIYPKSLTRISHLYSNINIGIIKRVQNIIRKKCFEINQSSFFEDHIFFPTSKDERGFEFLIKNKILLDDASSLYFDEIKTGLNFGTENIISHYQSDFFSCYDLPNIYQGRKDEKFIENKLKSNLKNSVQEFSKLEIDKTIPAGLISERFKLGWKNGTNNLIAPIGLDLIEADSIKQKALTWFGKLSFLNSYAKTHNTEFHLLISKPTGRNLVNAFNKAIKVIEKADAPIQIYTDTEIEKYSDYVSENLTGYLS